MPYEVAMVIVATSLVVIFGTFAYLLVNARSLMLLFKPISDGEIKGGPGPARTSKRGAAIALAAHFLAWGVAGLAWLYLLADVRASAPDTTPLEESGIVDGQAPSGN